MSNLPRDSFYQPEVREASKASPQSFYHYYSYGAERYITELLLRVRKEIFDIFMNEFSPTGEHTVLDVGASANDHPSSNYLEKHYPFTSKVTALSNFDVPELEDQFPGLTFCLGDARSLPFEDHSFDFVFSHAVIEHVGSRGNQLQFVNELFRVAKRGVIFSTPNRWHPIESHTGLPLLHFLPPATFRAILRMLNKTMYATEETLNLLSRGDIINIMNQFKTGLEVDKIQVRDPRYHLASVNWLGIPSNFAVVIRK